jgi:hypothetical protein
VFLAAYYGYWLRPDQLQCQASRAEKEGVRKADDVLAALQAGGFRYIVVERDSHGELLGRLLQAQAPIHHVVEYGNVVVYRVPPAVTGQPPQCVETRPGEWKVLPHGAPK